MKRIFVTLAFCLMITGTSFADDFFNPPPLNPELPPWMQDNSQTQQPQAQQGQSQQPQQAQPIQSGQPQQGQSQAQPMPENAGPAPDFSSPESSGDEEEGSPFDFEGGGGGGGGKGSDQGKQNFQILDKVERSKNSNDCVGWGTSFLGTRVFTSESMCRNELDQQLETSRDRINNYADHTEKEVLRSVIQGKVSREKSRDFHLDFSALKDGISLAAKTGCKCLE